MDYKWHLRATPDPSVTAHLSEVLNVHPILAQLLAHRGVTTFESAREFFRPNLAQLHDPFLMADMQAAVLRLQTAIKKGETIMLYGDYDVDGTTAVSLMYAYFSGFYNQLHTYIPDRYKEGYGVSTAGIDAAKSLGITLIVALDCGVKSVDKVQYAKAFGIDFIICDHHNPGAELPDAIAVLDPKRADCQYPYKELSGCGVGFKLVQAFHAKRGGDFEDLHPLLDLLAVSIGADIVPVTGENRILAHFGMQVLNQNPRPGLMALMGGPREHPYSITDVVFTAGPRINAAGRMEHGKIAVELLTSTDATRVKTLAAEVNALNAQRQSLDKSITATALEMIRPAEEWAKETTVVYDPNWSKGVIGIVASRLIEHRYRPTIVFTKSGEKLAGSARSIYGFDVYEALEASSEFLEQFGGHMYAAGMTLHPEHFESFRNKFEAVVKASLPDDLKSPVIQYDAEAKLEDFDFKFLNILQQFGPFGPENMNPIFCLRGLMDTGASRPVGADEAHLKLQLVDPESGVVMDGIAFKMGPKLALLQSGPVDVVAHLEDNVWKNSRKLQLRALDIRPAQPFEQNG